MREAYKTSILKKYPFPVWKDEIFAPEQLCLDAMALDGYKIRWYKDAVYVAEYLEDGLTQGNWNLLRQNKMGYAMLNNQALLYREGFISKYRAAGEMIALSLLAGHPSYILQSNKKGITFLALPFGLLQAVRRHEQFKWGDPIHQKNLG